MPKNPQRDSAGGDVEGEIPIDVTMGEAIRVSKASFDPGYSLQTTLENGYVTKADLVRGYCDYGKAVGKGED